MRFDANFSLKLSAVIGGCLPIAWKIVSGDYIAAQSSCVPLDPHKDKLKLVQVVFRHGARTPLTDKHELWGDVSWDVCGSAFKAVPLNVSDSRGNPRPPSPGDERQIAARLPGGCSKGELTLVGQAQAYFLGQWLRKRYVEELGFLPVSYTADLVRGRTTNYQRTIATLQGVLTGMYPETTDPISVVTATDVDEVLFADTKNCPHLGTFMRHAKVTLAEQQKLDLQRPQLVEQTKAAFAHVSEEFWSKKWHFTDIHDVVTTMTTHGKALPDALTPQLRQAINQQATMEFRTFIAPSLKDENGVEMVRLSMGRLLGLLVDNMDKAAKQKQQQPLGAAAAVAPKLMLYSGHDSTILPLLVALGLEPRDWPPYLSNVVLELWEQPGDSGAGSRHVVRVLYNQNELELTGCPQGCCRDLAGFREEVVGPFVLSQQDHREACTAQFSHDKPLPKPKTISSASDLDDI